jgi:anthranilate phosphoribosyltransferase
VILNAAAALWTVGIGATPRESAERAAAALDSGAARQKLAAWVEVSHT